MIYIRIEMWPRGDKTNPKLLHEGVIYNDGTGDRNNGSYTGHFSKRGGFGKKSDLPRRKLTGVLRETQLTGFKRLRQSAWALLARLLWDSNV